MEFWASDNGEMNSRQAVAQSLPKIHRLKGRIIQNFQGAAPADFKHKQALAIRKFISRFLDFGANHRSVDCVSLILGEKLEKIVQFI